MGRACDYTPLNPGDQQPGNDETPTLNLIVKTIDTAPIASNFFEVSARTKRFWAACRRTPRFHGGFRHPGLFPNVELSLLVLIVLIAILLEALGLWAFSAVTAMQPAALLAFFLLDGLGAWLHVAKNDLVGELAARKAVVSNEAESARADAMLPWWVNLLRATGLLILVGLFVFKTTGFVSEVSSESPGGLVVGIAVSYLVVLAIHCNVTGHFLLALRFRIMASREFRQVMGRSAHGHHLDRIGNVTASRQHEFHSEVALNPASLGHGQQHRIEAINDETENSSRSYRLVSYGVITDADADSLIGFQRTPAAKAFLAKEILELQLQILESDPVVLAGTPISGAGNLFPGKKNSSTVSADSPANSGARTTVNRVLGKHSGVASDAGSRSRTSVVGPVVAAIGLASLTSCGGEKNLGLKGSAEVREIPLTVAFTGPMENFPDPVVRVFAPSSPWPVEDEAGKAGDVIPSASGLRLDIDPVEEVRLIAGIEGESNLFGWFGGAGPRGKSTLEARRRAIRALETMPKLLTEVRPEGAGASIDRREKLADWVQAVKAEGGKVFALACSDGDDREHPKSLELPGGESIGICRDPEVLWNAIAEALTESGAVAKLGILYDNASAYQESEAPGLAEVSDAAGEVAAASMADLEIRLVAPALLTRQLLPEFLVAWGANSKAVRIHRVVDSEETQSIDVVRRDLKIRFSLREKQPGETVEKILLGPPDGSTIVLSGEKIADRRIRSAFLGIDAVAVVSFDDSFGSSPPSLAELAELFGRPTNAEPGIPIHGAAGETLEAFGEILFGEVRPNETRFSHRLILHPEDRVPGAAMGGKGVGFCSIAALKLKAPALAIAADHDAIPVFPDSIGVGSEDYSLCRRLHLFAASPVEGGGLPPNDERAEIISSLLAFASSPEARKVVQDAGLVVPGSSLTAGPRLRKGGPVTPEKEVPLGEESRAEISSWEKVDIPVRFANNSALLDDLALVSLERFVEWYRGQPSPRLVQLVGHADSTGSEEENEHLGHSRAVSVMHHLIGLGLEKERILVESKGDTEPIASNDHVDGRQKNRRVEIMIQGAATAAGSTSAAFEITEPKAGAEVGTLVPVEAVLRTELLNPSDRVIFGVRPLSSNEIWIQAEPSIRTVEGKHLIEGFVHCGRWGNADSGGVKFKIFALIVPETAPYKEGDVVDMARVAPPSGVASVVVTRVRE